MATHDKKPVYTQFLETIETWPEFSVNPLNCNCDVYLNSTSQNISVIEELLVNSKSLDELQHNLSEFIKERKTFLEFAHNYLKTNEYHDEARKQWQLYFS